MTAHSYSNVVVGNSYSNEIPTAFDGNCTADKS